jgi:hypothetical protein
MAIDFPASPTLNDVFTVGNVTYVWDGTKWTASVTGGISLDKIEEGNTSAEVIDTGSDGRFVVTTEGTERLRVINTGNVGIGTTSPGYPLHVFSSTSTVGIRVDGGGDSIVSFANAGSAVGAVGIAAGNIAGGGSGNIGIQSGSSLLFATGGVNEKARIDSSGRLGIGTSSPNDVLHVEGTIRTSSSSSNAQFANNFLRSNQAGTFYFDQNSGSQDFAFRLSNVSNLDTTAMTIKPSGSVGIGTTSPGMKLTINDTTTAQIQLGYNDSIYGRIGRNSSGNYEFSSYENGGNLLFGTTGTTGSTTERVRIDSSGRLLVGTSSAVSTQWAPNLQVVGADTPCSFVLARNDTTVAVNTTLAAIRAFGNSSSGPYEECSRISTEADGDHGPGDKPTRLAFWTTADGASTPTERMRIASNGIIVARNSVGDTLNLYNAASAGTSNAFIYGAHSSASAYTGTTSFVVWTNGNVVNTNGSYTTISDAKLKENIVSAGSQWNDIKAIQIRNWNFKAETGNETHRQIGPIAQEVEAVCPGLVFEIPDRDQDGNETGEVTKGINQSVLYMKAVKALQEAIAKIETLEGMVAVNNITIDEQQHQLSTLAARLTALENA